MSRKPFCFGRGSPLQPCITAPSSSFAFLFIFLPIYSQNIFIFSLRRKVFFTSRPLFCSAVLFVMIFSMTATVRKIVMLQLLVMFFANAMLNTIATITTRPCITRQGVTICHLGSIMNVSERWFRLLRMFIRKGWIFYSCPILCINSVCAAIRLTIPYTSSSKFVFWSFPSGAH